MDAQELVSIVARLRGAATDSSDVEVKSAAGGFPKKLVHTLSAFSNTAGGTVVLGLDESSGFTPVAGFNASAMADALAGACDQLQPPVRPIISIEDFEGAQVVVAEVPEMELYSKPCWVKSQSKYQGSYVRTHDGDRHLSAYEIDRLEENKMQPTWDLELVEGAAMDDLDSEIVDAILRRERQVHPAVFGKLDDNKALTSLHIAGKDAQGMLRPTLAGLLAAGIYPQEFFPRLNVTFTAYLGTGKNSDSSGQRFLDNASFVGPIPVLVNEVVNAVTRNMRTGGVIAGAFREDLPDYPPVAVREAIANALMHRDYSPQARGSQVQVNMYVDRLEIINPGGLHGVVTEEDLGTIGIASSRNQRLSSLLEATPLPGKGYVAENRGTGYIEIIDQLARELLPPPQVQNTLSMFALTFVRRGMTEPERRAARSGGSKESVVEYLRQHHAASTRELAAAAGLSANGVRRILNQLIDAGIIERTEPLKSPKQRYRLL